MKNILIVSHTIPYPLNSGGRQAIFNGILAIRNHFNIFITFPTDDYNHNNNQKELEQILGPTIKIIPYSCKKYIDSRKISLKEIIVGKTRQMLDKLSPIPKQNNPYRAWIEELLPKPQLFSHFINILIQEYNIDIVQCEMLRNLALIHSLPSSVKKVFVHHELGFVRHQLEIKNIINCNFDGYAFLQTSKILEIGLLNKYDRIITLSSLDSMKLSEAGVICPISTSFAIVNSICNSISEPQAFSNLVFIGPDNHIPNYVGVLWFLENCWEKLLKIDDNYNLTIIGLWSEKNINNISLKYRNIHFSGFVNNLSIALQGKILIVPITIGSGIRMKILEAASLGIPFISTTIGAEGIPIIHKKHGLLADSPKEFINAIIEMRDFDLQKKITQEAYRLIQKDYSIEALRQNRLLIYNQL